MFQVCYSLCFVHIAKYVVYGHSSSDICEGAVRCYQKWRDRKWSEVCSAHAQPISALFSYYSSSTSTMATGSDRSSCDSFGVSLGVRMRDLKCLGCSLGRPRLSLSTGTSPFTGYLTLSRHFISTFNNYTKVCCFRICSRLLCSTPRPRSHCGISKS